MKRIQSYLAYTTLALFLAPGFSIAGAIGPELEQALSGLGPDDEVAVIITLKDQVDLKGFKDKNKAQRRAKLVKALKDKSEKSQKPIKAFLQQNKAKKTLPFWVFNGLATTVQADLIEQLSAMDAVESIRLDATLSAEPQADAAAVMPTWNLEAIGAPDFWGSGDGTGIVLANMDTGVNAGHPDLASRWRGGSNSWYDPNGQHSTPYDKTGHGTQVMGVMVGGDASGSAIGVAPGAQWIAVKIFNDAGVASYSAIHSGFEWLMDPDGDESTNDAPDVVNNSWGYPQLAGSCFNEFVLDVEALKAADIGVVFSAGNGGPYASSSESPANYAESFPVGSVGLQLGISDFSARGPSACTGEIYPEIVAPGEVIYTADLGNYYASVQGTSFAAPHIAGAMGLLISAHPSRSIDDIEAALKATAVDSGVAGPDNDYGSGLLDVVAADAWLANNQPACTDGDGDGFCAEADSITAQDCNDGNGSINPGASEIKHDGIDQDCNGYDLTIDITKAQYSGSTLAVEATSALGGDAALVLDGYGAMNFSRKGGGKWSISVSGVANPGSVIVSGVEGDEQAAVTADEVGSSIGGGKGGGKKKK